MLYREQLSEKVAITESRESTLGNHCSNFSPFSFCFCFALSSLYLIFHMLLRPKFVNSMTWHVHMHAGVVCYLNKQRTSLTWHVPHKPHTRVGTSRTGCVRPRDRVFGVRSRDRTGLDFVCHLAMTCTNTKKQLFLVAYPL